MSQDRPPRPEPAPPSRAVALVGAGLAGLACALADAGRPVTVFDKGRGLGGRLATRRIEGLAFDHGAQYVTARDPDFRALLEAQVAAGSVAPWTGREPSRAEGANPRFVGVPGMSGLAKPLAEGLPLHRQTRIVALAEAAPGWRLTDDAGATHGPFARVVVAVPAPQAEALLAGFGAPFDRLATVRIAPCWALLAAFDETADPGWDIRRPEAGPLAWIARNESKPGRPGGARQWVAHATPEWSAAHLEEPAERVQAALLAALADTLGGRPTAPAYAAVHRWRYARTLTPLGQPVLHDPARGLAAIGDWCLGDRVEAAYLSGAAMAEALLAEAG